MMDGQIVHSIALRHGLTHSETLMPAVEAAMTASGLTCADIDVFAAVAGPGSFTGVRLGICAAKGFAHAVGRPCAPVHALEALAMNFYGFDGWSVRFWTRAADRSTARCSIPATAIPSARWKTTRCRFPICSSACPKAAG